ncbi:MAG: ADP-glyceromanno-heptose 6-epimerase [Oligoflexales bacterium]|nr:ADP-glyceromanno-heptose 6-epimerase [Oligoflexales bacterium]
MIIVTGAAGFIGSAILWRLNQEGLNDIFVVDHFGKQSKWKNLVKRNFSSMLHKNEFLAWLQTEGKKQKIEAIFHMGACSSTLQMDMDYLLSNNVQYSMKIFEHCAEFSIPLIYASSAATYGLGEHGYSDQAEVLPKLHPINPYGYSKQLFDLWASKQTRKPPFWCGLKFFNVFGPNEYHKEDMRSLVAKAYPQIIKSGELKLFKSHHPDYGHGEQKRDFIYIKDVVDVILHCWKEAIPSGIYNVGTGQARTFADLGSAVFSALNMKPVFEWVDMPHELRDQYQYFTQADLNQLRKIVRYRKPFTALEDAIQDFVRNYISQKDQYL